MKYLLYPLLFIFCSSCGYDTVTCVKEPFYIRLDNFTPAERDSIFLTEYVAGSNFTDTLRSVLSLRIGDSIQFYKEDEAEREITFLKLGMSYRFSNLEYEGETERRKKAFDMGGSYQPTPCFSYVSSLIINGSVVNFTPKYGESYILPRL